MSALDREWDCQGQVLQSWSRQRLPLRPQIERAVGIQMASSKIVVRAGAPRKSSEKRLPGATWERFSDTCLQERDAYLGDSSGRSATATAFASV